MVREEIKSERERKKEEREVQVRQTVIDCFFFCLCGAAVISPAKPPGGGMTCQALTVPECCLPVFTLFFSLLGFRKGWRLKSEQRHFCPEGFLYGKQFPLF